MLISSWLNVWIPAQFAMEAGEKQDDHQKTSAAGIEPDHKKGHGLLVTQFTIPELLHLGKSETSFQAEFTQLEFDFSL